MADETCNPDRSNTDPTNLRIVPGYVTFNPYRLNRLMDLRVIDFLVRSKSYLRWFDTVFKNLGFRQFDTQILRI